MSIGMAYLLAAIAVGIGIRRMIILGNEIRNGNDGDN